ncbi:MAG: carotenoid biosynthesis protein [Anaerolineales bacterium]|nr:carotenoid biosynthesis protein [Anaerolineales bacterium]
MRKTLPVLLIAYAALTVILQYAINTGTRFLLFAAPLAPLVGLTIALIHAKERMTWKRALWLLFATFTVSLAFESFGVLTGWIYGPYHYETKLGPLLFGLVPPIIPVAWFMMMYPSFVVADWVVPERARVRALWVAAAGAMMMTAWDVVMDPLMAAGGHWTWEVNGAYFGVPLQNFFGWWLTTFVSFLVFLWLGKPVLPQHSDGKFDQWVIVLFAITALDSIVGALLHGLGGAALAGIFAVTPWLFFGWTRMSERE